MASEYLDPLFTYYIFMKNMLSAKHWVGEKKSQGKQFCMTEFSGQIKQTDIYNTSSQW